MRGNNDAVWPSSPMPSTAMPAGCRACRFASATASSMLRPGRVSGSNRAPAAWPRSRLSCTRRALLSGSSGRSQRSSTSATSTRSHSSGACDSARNTGAGVLPPDSSRRARGCDMRSRRNAAAIATAAAHDHWSSLRNSCSETGSSRLRGSVALMRPSPSPGRRPRPPRPAGPAADAAPRASARPPSPARTAPSSRTARGTPSAAAPAAPAGRRRR